MIPFLQTGDSIYVCSPAKKVEAPIIELAIEKIEEQGFKALVSPNALGHHYYFSGTKEERLNDLQAGLDHPTAKAIFCARGGYGLIQLLDLLDWTEFRKNPKWIVGFSDVTNLSLELSRMNVPSLHATMALNFKDNSPETFHSLWSAIRGQSYEVSSQSNPYNRLGEVNGELIGGNLSILYSLLARIPKDVFRKKILFLEDVGENHYHFDRMIYALELAGIFEDLTALVIGGFTDVKDKWEDFGQNIHEILLRPVLDKNIPVCFDFPAGHQNDNQALIMGVQANLQVNSAGAKLSFHQPKA